MYLNNIQVQNFHGIRDINVDFKPGMNVIIGKNGAGKTSLLEAMKVSLSQSFSSINGVGIHLLENADVHYEMRMSGETTSNIEYFFPVSILADIKYGESNYSLDIKKENSADRSRFSRVGFSEVLLSLLKDENSKLPFIYYNSSDRVASKTTIRGNEDNVTISVKRNMRTDGYLGALDGLVYPDNLRKWCLKMEMIEYQENKKVWEYLQFRKIVSDFIINLAELKGEGQIYYSMKAGDLVFKRTGKETAIHDMSAGYQTILYLIADIAYRLSLLNPSSDYNANEAEGIVVIDEIDLHIHPEWQWKILNVFQTLFPKIQFIVATHSPMIISSARNANLIMLRDCSEVDYLESAYGYDIEEVLALRQQSDDKPKEIEERYSSLQNALDANDDAKAQEIVKITKLEFGEDSAVSRKINDFYEVNKWIEED